MKTTPNTPRESGFTAVELLVTIVVTAMFAIAFYQLFISVSQSSSNARHRAVASDIAYDKLRRYASATITPADWSLAFSCDATVGAGNTNDVTQNSAATGTQLEGGPLTSTTVGLPAPVSYSVRALAVFGCNAGNTGKPIRVEAQVTYGPANTVIKHTTLVGY